MCVSRKCCAAQASTDLKKQQIMDRTQIASLCRRTLFLPVDRSVEYSLVMTSGTSGAEPIMAKLPTQHVKAWAEGAQRRVVCVGTLNLRLRNVLLTKNNGGTTIAVDRSDLSSELAPLLSDFEPDCLLGVLSFVARVTEYMHANARHKVRTIRLASEMLLPNYERFFQVQFPFAERKMLYISVEAGAISKPTCAFLPKNCYHPESGVTIEIEDPDKCGVGNLLVSRTLVGDIVLKRYRIGDLASLRDGACPCGEKQSFELHGRLGLDTVKLAGMILHRVEFDRVAVLCSAFFDDYRAEARVVEVEGKMQAEIILRIYRARGEPNVSECKRVAELFHSELFLTPTETLGTLVEQERARPLIVVSSPEPFQPKNKDIKLRHIVT